MAAPGSWRPGTSQVFLRSITNAQVNATPAAFAGQGSVARVINSGATAVDCVVTFFLAANGTPTLAFPADSATPVGQPSAIQPPAVSVYVKANQTVYVDGVAGLDSFAAIGSAAGPTLIIVQKGEGNGP